MVFDEVFDPFIAESPVSVMFRGTLEAAFSSERLDRIFENVAESRSAASWRFPLACRFYSAWLSRGFSPR